MVLVPLAELWPATAESAVVTSRKVPSRRWSSTLPPYGRARVTATISSWRRRSYSSRVTALIKANTRVAPLETPRVSHASVPFKPMLLPRGVRPFPTSDEHLKPLDDTARDRNFPRFAAGLAPLDSADRSRRTGARSDP